MVEKGFLVRIETLVGSGTAGRLLSQLEKLGGENGLEHGWDGDVRRGAL